VIKNSREETDFISFCKVLENERTMDKVSTSSPSMQIDLKQRKKKIKVIDK